MKIRYVLILSIILLSLQTSCSKNTVNTKNKPCEVDYKKFAEEQVKDYIDKYFQMDQNIPQEERRHARCTLVALGNRAIPYLVPRLKNNSEKIRALGFIVEIKKKESIPYLIQFINGQDKELRECAIGDLLILGDRSILPIVKPLVMEEEGRKYKYLLAELGDKDGIDYLVNLFEEAYKKGDYDSTFYHDIAILTGNGFGINRRWWTSYREVYHEDEVIEKCKEIVNWWRENRDEFDFYKTATEKIEKGDLFISDYLDILANLRDKRALDFIISHLNTEDKFLFMYMFVIRKMTDNDFGYDQKKDEKNAIESIQRCHVWWKENKNTFKFPSYKPYFPEEYAKLVED